MQRRAQHDPRALIASCKGLGWTDTRERVSQCLSGADTAEGPPPGQAQGFPGWVPQCGGDGTVLYQPQMSGTPRLRAPGREQSSLHPPAHGTHAGDLMVLAGDRGTEAVWGE